MVDTKTTSGGRRKIIAGNWKMHNTCQEARELVSEVGRLIPGNRTVDVVICPPFTALSAIRDLTRNFGIGLGAQNMFWKDEGAYTGQISARMLADVGADYVILGHSEARGRFGVPEPNFDESILKYFGDSDSTVNRKLHAAINGGLVPICCVGETLQERDAAITDVVVESQTERALQGVTALQAAGLIIAYEPVWAIGTGRVCEAVEADRVCGVIRSAIRRSYGDDSAERVRIQYGGSVKPTNAAELLNMPQIDGALVGGASLNATDFAAIIDASD
jgi:triosephosphate isomerase